MRLAIIGTGALATLFGGWLAQRTTAVPHLIGSWAEQITHLRQHGLIIHELDHSQTHIPTLPATAHPATIPPVHIALILVKSHQTPAAAQRARACLRADGLAITLQNGLGHEAILAQTLGAQRVACGTTAIGATLLGVGQVRHAGRGLTHLPPAAAPLVPYLQAAGIETTLCEDVCGLIWSKLIINAAINPLTALLRQPNGYLAQHPIAQMLMHTAAHEAAQVAQAHHIRLSYPPANAPAQAQAVAERTAANRSSMLQDVARGAPTEIEAITGQVVKYGRAANIPTPLNDLLLQLVRAGTQPHTPADLRHQLATSR